MTTAGDDAHYAILRGMVGAAILAPSSHNTQPWRFRISASTLDLYADPARHLGIIDRDRRQLVQSCGCALFNARVAARALGYDDEVTVMLVDRELPEHLATLHLGDRRTPTDLDRSLMKAIGDRHTNRRAFLPRPVAATHTDALAAVAAAEGVTMVRLGPEQKHSLAAVVEEADQRQFADPKFRDELSRWLAPAGSRRRDGIPFEEKEYGSTLPFAHLITMRSPSLGERFGMLEDALTQSSPVVVVLGTERDDPPSWLRCGEALQAVLLHATTLGLSAAFLNQALEIVELRARVSELVSIANPQMILRLGVPAEPVEHPAPRRPIDEVLEVVGSPSRT